MDNPLVDTGILIFAKAPEPGKVKTRMQPNFSKEQSSLLQEKLIRHTLNTAATSSHHVELWCSPSIDHDAFKRANKECSVPLFSQKGEDLGMKMAHAIKDAQTRHKKVLLIGTDCPLLTPKHLLDASQQLEGNDVVLIGANDGGYVLIGAEQSEPDCFEGIDWGSERVLAQTQSALEKNNQSYCITSSLPDLDYYSDWKELPKELQDKLHP